VAITATGSETTVVYHIDEAEERIVVALIAHRREAY
jgi:hypothetical protein